MTHVVCLLNVESDRATFTWSEGPASFEPYTLDGMVYKDFKEIAEEAREKLADLVKDYLFDEQRLPQSAFALAEAGHELYRALFDPGAEQARQAKQVCKWLEELAHQREVDTLEIVVESPWSLPWNIVYDQEPDKEAFLAGEEKPDRWKPFWGLRYNLAGGRKVDPLRRMPLLKDPKVLMVVDPEIRDGLPEEQQKRLTEFVESHKFKMVHGKDELQEAISAERPDLLYWLSHAEPDALVLAGEPISPRNMRKLLRQDDDDNFGGLAFLNACQTAEGGASGSFFEAFHNVGFAGMIGTEHQTVDQFANPLGLDFLEAFLDRGEPVGLALHTLRGRVPLGLLYGVYCPPDIRVDRGDIRDSVKISEVHGEGVALSAPLAADKTATRTLPPLPDEPYRSLAYYERNDRALFAGRDDDIERFATYLDDASTRILVLHGESGVGKSSFLHAGVIPYLEEECLGYRFIREREADESAGEQGSVIFIRATNDLFGQLAQALCEFCARPYEYQTPLGEQVSADLPGVLGEFVGDDVNQGVLRTALRSDPSLLGRMMSRISDRLPFAAILVIDQGEEVFTLAQTPEDQQRGRQALDMLRRTIGAAGNFKVIFSLRTEYYGRVIDRLRRGLQDAGRIREYLLTDFDEDALLEAIRRPTADEPIPYTSEVPFDKYGFRYAEGVAEEIAHRVVRYTTQRRDSVLPLVQVICAQLSRLARRRDDGTITMDDLEKLGGIEGGMRNHVEGLLGELLKGRPLEKKPLQKLFTQLYLKQPDGTLTTALLAEDEVQKRWTGRMPFDELLRTSRDMRLLKVNSLRIGMEEERHYVSLGHDALAKLAAAWDEELSRGARMRKMFAATAAAAALALVMAILWIRAEGARIRADKARVTADTNRRFSRELMSDLVPELNKQAEFPITNKTKLAEASRVYVEKFVAKKESESADTASLRADARYVIGRLDVEMEEYVEAIAAYEKARELQCAELKLERDDPDYASLVVSVDNEALARDLAYTLNALGDVYKRQGDKSENEALDAKDDKSIAAELQEQAREHWKTARDWFFRAATIRKEINPEEIDDRLLYASAVMNIGLADQSLGEYPSALKQFGAAAAIRSNVRLEAKADKTQKSIDRHIALGHLNLVDLLRTQKGLVLGEDVKTPEETVTDAITLYEELSKEDLTIQLELAKCYRVRGELNLEQLTDNDFQPEGGLLGSTYLSKLKEEDTSHAIEAYEHAKDICRARLFEEGPWIVDHQDLLLHVSLVLFDLYNAELEIYNPPPDLKLMLDHFSPKPIAELDEATRCMTNKLLDCMKSITDVMTARLDADNENVDNRNYLAEFLPLYVKALRSCEKYDEADEAKRQALENWDWILNYYEPYKDQETFREHYAEWVEKRKKTQVLPTEAPAGEDR